MILHPPPVAASAALQPVGGDLYFGGIAHRWPTKRTGRPHLNAGDRATIAIATVLPAIQAQYAIKLIRMTAILARTARLIDSLCAASARQSQLMLPSRIFQRAPAPLAPRAGDFVLHCHGIAVGRLEKRPATKRREPFLRAFDLRGPADSRG